MNIQSNLNSVAPLSPETSPARVGTSPGNTASATPIVAPTTVLEQDQTHWSQAAVLVSATSADSDVRLEKVAEIQQALTAGTYSVSPSDVAAKLIDHLLQS
jgi:flagellar biosynthesis anti-sigma factor FlgM